MSTGIVFYSRSNNTRVAAEFLAGMLKAELIELVEKGERKGFTGFIKSGYQAASGKKSELQGEPWENAKKYDNLYLLTPIWGGSITPAMNTFLGHADFEGQEVTVITFQADTKGSGSEKIYEKAKEKVERGRGKFLRGVALHSAAPGKFAGKDYIESQIDKIF